MFFMVCIAVYWDNPIRPETVVRFRYSNRCSTVRYGAAVLRDVCRGVLSGIRGSDGRILHIDTRTIRDRVYLYRVFPGSGDGVDVLGRAGRARGRRAAPVCIPGAIQTHGH